jgi:hypothetical protein
LSLLASTGADVYRVEPVIRSFDKRWMGFGLLDGADLRNCFEERRKFSPLDAELGTELWDAFRHRDNGRLIELGKTYSHCFPYLEEVCKAAIEMDTRPAELIREIQADGTTTFEEIFPEFTHRAGVYGYGDLQVRLLLDKLSS